jgi:putative DNA primase/helicase
LLMETRGEQHPTGLADLHGKRLMFAVETDEGRRLNESRIKSLTGGEEVKARRMRENFWRFDATHKLILVSNHRPTVRGADHAIWRRLRLVPFTVHFWDPDKGETGPEHLKADKSLCQPDAFADERPGILAWLVRGCLDWQAHGLPCPPQVLAATSEYRSSEDRIATFISERCIAGNNDFRIKTADLWTAYREWCNATGEQPGTAQAFGRALSDRSIQRDDGKRWYLGIALRPGDDQEQHP